MKVLAKVAIGAAAAVVGGLLFVRSVRQSRSEPYPVPPGQLAGWTLSAGEGGDATSPVLVLRGPGAIVENLSRQLFKRAMESFTSPLSAQIPLLMKGEYDRTLGGRVSPEQIMAAARKAGLGAAAPLSARCMAYRRSSDAVSTRQVYFLIFDLPAFAGFRQELAALAGGGGFDPAALAPTMFVAFSQSSADQWMPLQADPDHDCVAPIASAAAP